MNTVVIGSSREQKLPSLVLEYTVHKHASEPVHIIHTWDKTFPIPHRQENVSRTGFSFARFAIPSLVDYEGKAVYLECDQIVFRDVGELFALPFDGAKVLRPKNQASVLMLDCSGLRWDLKRIIEDLDGGRYTYRDLMENLCIVPSVFIAFTIPNHWNSLEAFDPKNTALLHYTNMAIQPWRKLGHPLGELWLNELLKAVLEKRISMATIEQEVAAKHVVPHVLEWVKKRIPRG